MANFSRFLGVAWGTQILPSAAIEQFDDNLSKCANFTDGSTHAPSAQVIVGGAGLKLTGASHMLSGQLEVESGADINVTNGGTITVASGGTLTAVSGGEVVLMPGAALRNKGVIDCQNGSNVTFKSGSTLVLNSGATTTCQSGSDTVYESGADATFEVGAHLDLQGDINVYATGAIRWAPGSHDVTGVTIGPDSDLTLVIGTHGPTIVCPAGLSATRTYTLPTTGMAAGTRLEFLSASSSGDPVIVTDGSTNVYMQNSTTSGMCRYLVCVYDGSNWAFGRGHVNP